MEKMGLKCILRDIDLFTKNPGVRSPLILSPPPLAASNVRFKHSAFSAHTPKKAPPLGQALLSESIFLR